jgi:hypothetical protein
MYSLIPGEQGGSSFFDLEFFAASAHKLLFWICSMFAQVRLLLNLLLVIGSCHSVNDPQSLW